MSRNIKLLLRKNKLNSFFNFKSFSTTQEYFHGTNEQLVQKPTSTNNIQTIYDIDELYHQCQPLSISKSCYHTLNSADQPIPADIFEKILKKVGILIVSLGYPETTSTSLEKIVNAIGIPHQHNKDGNVIWHVKHGGVSNNEDLARSHKLNEFVFHTDCSYEQNTPDYIALHCLRHDRFGGGKNLIIDCKAIINKLRPESLHLLQNEDVEIIVPPEFRNDINSIKAKLIDENLKVRFRKEIINEESLSMRMKEALEEFNSLCFTAEMNRSLELKDGEILFLDNKRFLHARTTIKDKERHLMRIRFFGR